MNFIPFDPRTGGLFSTDYHADFNHPKTLTHIPDNILFSKIEIPILLEKEEPDYSPDETLLTPGKEDAKVFTFYCDSVSGGEDFSGNGTKERPFRNLQHLFNTILCSNDILLLLYSLKYSIRICLKGVVDYKVDYISDNYFQLKFKHKWLIISKWEEAGEPEAIIQLDMSDFYHYYPLTNIHFQNIHFQNVKRAHLYHCFFEGCIFTHTRDLPGNSNNDFYNCDITFDLDSPWESGRNFKNCTMHFLPRDQDAQLWYSLYCNYMEGCQVFFEDEYFPYRNGSLAYDEDRVCLEFSGNCSKSDFSFALREPSTDQGFRSGNGLCTIPVLKLCGLMADCKITTEAEHHFPPLQENSNADHFQLNHLYVQALCGCGKIASTAIRCHVENKGIYGENAKGVFCGFYGSTLKLIDCTSSPSNDTSDNCVL